MDIIATMFHDSKWAVQHKGENREEIATKYKLLKNQTIMEFCHNF